MIVVESNTKHVVSSSSRSRVFDRSNAIMSAEKPEVDNGQHTPSSTSASDVEVVPESINEKRLLRTLDLRLLPAVSILYLLSFLDRSNGKMVEYYNMEPTSSNLTHLSCKCAYRKPHYRFAHD